jgi:type IV pilus assembly protein PilX
MHSAPGKNRFRREGGFVLIASLLMLVVMTVLAVSLYHNFIVQENVASNTKEKGRAFQVAQSALQYGEYVLVHDSASLPATVACPQTPMLSTITICSTGDNIVTPAAADGVMKLGNGMYYTAMEPPLNVSKAGGNDTYYDNPQFYLAYLGPAPGGLGQIYQVTALGYGSTPNAVAVVQSTYELSSNTKCLSCGP